MCGIFVANRNLIPEYKFISTLKLLAHRGPDALDYAVVSDYLVGHTRLAIWGLDKKFDQPYKSADDRYWLAFNGAIYNWKDLVKRFSLRPTTSDTDVVMQLWEKFGPNMLNHLNGMFAMVLVDKFTGNVFAARDRLGVKPLYFVETLNGAAFCSEIEPLLELNASKKIDEYSLEVFRNMRLWPEGKTLYSQISEVPPGTYLYGGKKFKYWDLAQVENPPPSQEELLSLLKNSVELRCDADVKASVYLSGGLDSSIVLALSGISEAWTVGTDFFDEHDEAKSISETIDVELKSITVSKSGFDEAFTRIMESRSTPIAVPNEVLLWQLNKNASAEGVKVFLSGEGADELFDGYSRIFDWSFNARLFDSREFAIRYSYTSNPNIDVIDAELANLRGETAYEKVSRFFVERHLKGLLLRLDASSMAHGIEARSPFLDYRLVERLFLAERAWKSEPTEKNPLRTLAKKLIPGHTFPDQKIGFPVLFPGETSSLESRKSSYDLWFRRNMQTLGLDNER